MTKTDNGEKDGTFYDRREYDKDRNLSSRIDRRGRRFLIWTYDIRDPNYCHEKEERTITWKLTEVTPSGSADDPDLSRFAADLKW